MLVDKTKKLIKRGLPSALFEVLLIFVGISLALAFDNWNTERQERALEREYLLSIHQNLVNNFAQIDDNLSLNAGRFLKSSQNVHNFLVGKKHARETLMDDFKLVEAYRTLSLETSGFTSVKSYGVHLIKSSKLRNTLIELHDRHFSRLIDVYEGLHVRKQAPELYSQIRYRYDDFALVFETPDEVRQFLKDRIPLRNMNIAVIGSYKNVIQATVPTLRRIDQVVISLEEYLKIESNQQDRLERIHFWEKQVADGWPIIDPLNQK